mmetsp:Transcript_18477/g.35163  ORF Transcript_18477/g.35163 Transcript_18477/m.35163 type:complete len:217 (+) Transcript_18477:353-1003(+)
MNAPMYIRRTGNILLIDMFAWPQVMIPEGFTRDWWIAWRTLVAVSFTQIIVGIFWKRLAEWANRLNVEVCKNMKCIRNCLISSVTGKLSKASRNLACPLEICLACTRQFLNVQRLSCILQSLNTFNTISHNETNPNDQIFARLEHYEQKPSTSMMEDELELSAQPSAMHTHLSHVHLQPSITDNHSCKRFAPTATRGESDWMPICPRQLSSEILLA